MKNNYTKNFDPLKHYFVKLGYDRASIKKIVSGERYTATLLCNGSIGVCANLTTEVNLKDEVPENLDINRETDRIIYTSYLNATLNYENNYQQQQDIFQAINFEDYNQITMIGYFIPLVKKFDEAGIKLNIFDRVLKDKRLLPEEDKRDYVRTADSLIISGTTLQNGTFSELLSFTKNKCDIFLLGPSSIMDKDMFLFTRIKVIFGAVFNKNDDEILRLIKAGYGTRDFIKRGTKVVFLKDQFKLP